MDAMVTDADCPNGLAFSPDEAQLYVADTGRIYMNDPIPVRASDVAADGCLTGGARCST